MDKFDELKTVWHSAKTDSLPTSHALLQEIKKFRNQRLQKKWLVIACSCFLAGLMMGVLVIIDFKLPSTYIGGSLIALSSLLLAYTNIRSLKRFMALQDGSNLEFVSFIEQTRQNQIYYYKKTQARVMVLCLVGLLFYLYEPFLQYPGFAILLYSLSCICLLVLWFWLRPRYFKKDSEKLDAILRVLENISKQLK